jgi:hypothetical protein
VALTIILELLLFGGQLDVLHDLDDPVGGPSLGRGETRKKLIVHPAGHDCDGSVGLGHLNLGYCLVHPVPPSIIRLGGLIPSDQD